MVVQQHAKNQQQKCNRRAEDKHSFTKTLTKQLADGN